MAESGGDDVIVNISRPVLELLDKNSWQSNGPLVGFMLGYSFPRDVEYNIQAVGRCQASSLSESAVKEEVQIYQQMLPAGMKVCGLLLLSDPSSKTADGAPTLEATSELLSRKIPLQLLVEMVGGRLVVCHLAKTQTSMLDSNMSVADGLTPLRPATVNMKENSLEDMFFLRLQASIPLTLTVENEQGSWDMSVEREVERYGQQVEQGQGALVLEGVGLWLTGEGLLGDTTLHTGLDLCRKVMDNDPALSGSRKKDAFKAMGPIPVQYCCLLSAGELRNNTAPPCAPVVHCNSGSFKGMTMTLPLDVVCPMSPDMLLGSLYPSLSQAMRLQLSALQSCITQHAKGDKVHTPAILHFQPGPFPFLVSLAYPRGVEENMLEATRAALHERFFLPKTRPYFRRSNAFAFLQDRTRGGHLLLPHRGVPPSGVVSGHSYLVEGLYSYHHYMQDNFDDNKWGCAYRSLQTLISWFVYNGYSDIAIPNHRQIQEALVAVKDKDPSFIGSRKWIGSFEVSFCMEYFLKVSCKMVNVSQGSELGSQARVLADHFSKQGTPVMIGGGVLAHTILGLDYSETTGEVKFLVLDPHYTGVEDRKTIVDKGWCGWKTVDFWDANAFYNMCLPQRPVCI